MSKLARTILLGILAASIAAPLVGCGSKEEPAGVGAMDQKEPPAKNGKIDPMASKGGGID